MASKSPEKKAEPKNQKTEPAAKVRIRVLKAVGFYEHGLEYLVSPEEAQTLCAVRERNNGHEVIKFRCAVPVDEIEAMKKAAVTAGGLTLDELRELGYRGNVVATPKEKAFEQRLSDIAASKPAMETTQDEAGMAQARDIQKRIDARNAALSVPSQEIPQPVDELPVLPETEPEDEEESA